MFYLVPLAEMEGLQPWVNDKYNSIRYRWGLSISPITYHSKLVAHILYYIESEWMKGFLNFIWIEYFNNCRIVFHISQVHEYLIRSTGNGIIALRTSKCVWTFDEAPDETLCSIVHSKKFFQNSLCMFH